jgi:hypothetical protein
VYQLTASASLRVRVLGLRAISIALGLVLGYLVYRLAAEALPSRPALWPAAAGVTLLIPMQTAVAASINNDLLAAALATGTLVFLAKTRGQLGSRGAVVLGLLCGALLLTKLTVYAFVLIALGWVISRCITAPTRPERAIAFRSLLITAAVTVLISGWWFARNGLVYGWDDPLASTRHAEVVVGQAQWAHYGPEAWVYFATTLFHSFFAQFGWMAVVVDDLTYSLFGALVVFSIAGLMLRPLDRGELEQSAGLVDDSPPAPQQTEPATKLIFAVTILAVVGQLLYYNLSFIQAQGRYLFPAIGPIAIVLCLGWAQLSDGVGRYRSLMGRSTIALWAALALTTAFAGIADWEPGPRATALFVGVSAGLIWLSRGLTSTLVEGAALALAIAGIAALNLACLTRFVVPYYFG